MIDEYLVQTSVTNQQMDNGISRVGFMTENSVNYFFSYCGNLVSAQVYKYRELVFNLVKSITYIVHIETIWPNTAVDFTSSHNSTIIYVSFNLEGVILHQNITN